MNCEDFGRYLDNYENLTASEKSQMLEHAAMCEKCQAELDFFLSMIATANSLPKIEPPADFMDSLNARLDAEDKRVVSVSKIAYHIRRNWKQYTAAAACLALVTVITANHSTLLDRYVENNDDGVISEETIPADSTAAPENEAIAPVAETTPAPAQAEAPATQNQASAAQTAAAKPTQTAPQAASAAGTPRRQPAASTQTTATVISTPVTAPTAESNAQASEPSAQAQATITAEPAQTAEITESKATSSSSKPQEDYGIARGLESTASVTYDLRAEDVKASLDASEIKSNYSLAEGGEEIAYGRYYTLDRNGNPISSASGI
ncbi:MAG: hypothetical protein IJH17_00035, partial [Clostridia bacterium]|nr:hypothetical protein [Clostridia bacterium]